MEPNRRRYPRVRAQGLAAHLSTVRGRTQCQVENISLGGMFVRTDRLEQVGTGVAVLLVKPGWKKQLSLTARVTSRVDGLAGKAARIPGLGLQFTTLDTDAHERLRSLLRQLGAPDEQAEIPVPQDSIAAELRPLETEPAIGTTPAAPTPQRTASPARAVPPPPPAESEVSVENARLKVQLRGLAMQLSDAQQIVVQRDTEIERLREQLEDARARLERALRGG
jgi:Tfp pilus assembly protein PilZ